MLLRVLYKMGATLSRRRYMGSTKPSPAGASGLSPPSSLLTSRNGFRACDLPGLSGSLARSSSLATGPDALRAIIAPRARAAAIGVEADETMPSCSGGGEMTVENAGGGAGGEVGRGAGLGSTGMVGLTAPARRPALRVERDRISLPEPALKPARRPALLDLIIEADDGVPAIVGAAESAGEVLADWFLLYSANASSGLVPAPYATIMSETGESARSGAVTATGGTEIRTGSSNGDFGRSPSTVEGVVDPSGWSR